MIKISSLSKSYGNNEVLKGIDLEIESKKIIGLVGENGAGKTSLFKSICGLISCEGKIEVKDELKDKIGYVPTHPEFMSRMTGEEFLILMCKAKDVEIPKMSDVNLFDLPLKEYAVNYSTGMKKKLALLGSVVQKNDFFILDEPFNGVDISSNLIILQLLERLRVSGKTIIISSHIFETLILCCDYILHLENGVISKEIMPNQYDHFGTELKSRSESQYQVKMDLFIDYLK